jgi:thioester reductase-like protein
MSELLVTGATGFLGMSYVAGLLEEEDGPAIHVLVRDPEGVERMLTTLYANPPAGAARLRALPGDLTAPGLGLSRRARDELAGVSHVVHCAASISFSLPLDEARAINVAGTERVLDLAAGLPGLDRLVHVSTAYVGGRDHRTLLETDRGGGDFRNTYEQTKWEAEQVVSAAGLPAVVVRPSIVVGDSRSGWTPAFNVLYWPLQAFARGLVSELPADPAGIVDVVPVDHVTRVIAAATFAPDAHGTYHAVAGLAAPTVEELVELAARTLDMDPPPLVAPRDDEEHPVGVFAPYFDVRCRFGEERTRSELGLVAPDVRDYFPDLMAYARTSRWGRRPLARQAA